MSPSKATHAQLVPIIEKVLDRPTNGGPPVVVVHADPAAVPHVGEVRGRAVAVHGSSSPLEIRSILRSAGAGGVVVVLTDCERAELGDDLLARVSFRRLDRWDAVCHLFGAERPTAELSRRERLADALVEAAPVGKYPRVATRVLDLETAANALLRASLGIADEVDGLDGLLRWLERPDVVGRIATARGQYLDDLLPALRARFGAGVDAVLAALAAGRAGDLVPMGLAAGTVHAPPADDVAAVVRLDERLGAHGLGGESYRAWGEAAERAVGAADDPARAAGWLDRGDAILRDLGAEALAHRSKVLPAGFDQRVRAAAEALARWPAPGADDAIRRVADHAGARGAAARVERLRMAARMLRRGSLALTGLAGGLAEVASAYERDGAWLDAARTVVSRGDADPVLTEVCARLTADADRARQADGPGFARVAGAAADGVPAPHVGVEDVLDRVVAPLASLRPVLLVVLDGMGWPTFTEVLGALEGAGWSPWRRDGLSQVGVAALPTVTEVSRTSLLAGRLRTGDDGSERRAFASHPGLLAVSAGGPAPALFHKRHLRLGGLDTRPDDVVAAVADERRRVVGLVINNIDERLKDVAQPVGAWGFGDLDPLRTVLDEARRAGRVVVVTADHGHVLDRGAEDRPPAGGGERWRLPAPPAGDGEVAVEGRRVVVDGNAAVLPWAEQVRYGPRRNGYHGGLTPKELFVPLVVLSTDDLPESSGWVPTGFRRPPWWHPAPLATAAPAPATRFAPPTPTLFDLPAPAVAGSPAPVAAPAAGAQPGWVDALLASPVLAERRANPRVRLADAQLCRLLAVLDAAGTMAVGAGRLAAEAELPAARIGGYVAQLQELLNVDGYGVVTTAGDEVRFDRSLLLRQFSL